DDLIQETFARALAAQERYQAGTNARAWLHAILLNAARSMFRRERRDVRLRERYAREPTAAGEPRDPVEGRRALPRPIPSLLASLPETYRAVVEQVDVEGRSYREVAERLGVPV